MPDGTVYLENGRAFRPEGILSPSQAASLFRKAHVEYQRAGEGGSYTMTLGETDTAALLALLPEGFADTSGISGLTMALTTEDGRAVSLTLTAGEAEDLTIRVDFLSPNGTDAPAVPQR